MSILSHTINFIHAWEQDCQASDFTLRFPLFSDFICYLETLLSEELFEKIHTDSNQMKNVRSMFYAVLKAHIGDLCIKEKLWSEQAIA